MAFSDHGIYTGKKPNFLVFTECMIPKMTKKEGFDNFQGVDTVYKFTSKCKLGSGESCGEDNVTQ